MARQFISARSQKLTRTTAVVAAYPLTMACWATVQNVTTAHALMALGRITNNSGSVILAARGDLSGDPIRAAAQDDAGASGAALTSTGYLANTLFHACGTFTNDTTRAAYLNGAGKGTDATSIAMPSVDRTSIGAVERLTPVSFADAIVFDAAIWNIALSDADVAALAVPGTSPLSVQSGSLVAYWPLNGGQYVGELDSVGGFDLTFGGSIAEFGLPVPNVQVGPVCLRRGSGRARQTYPGIDLAAVTNTEFIFSAPNHQYVGPMCLRFARPELRVYPPNDLYIADTEFGFRYPNICVGPQALRRASFRRNLLTIYPPNDLYVANTEFIFPVQNIQVGPMCRRGGAGRTQYVFTRRPEAGHLHRASSLEGLGGVGQQAFNPSLS